MLDVCMLQDAAVDGKSSETVGGRTGDVTTHGRANLDKPTSVVVDTTSVSSRHDVIDDKHQLTASSPLSTHTSVFIILPASVINLRFTTALSAILNCLVPLSFLPKNKTSSHK